MLRTWVIALVACKASSSSPPPRPEPTVASKPSTSAFAIGDKVVLPPVAVMTITAIGTRRALTPPDTENVDVDVAGALQGSSVLATVPADDTQVYALRFLGDTRDSMLLEVAAAGREGLRHVSTPAQIDAFLHAIDETVRAKKRGAPRPADLSRATIRARNDLQALAKLYPYLGLEPKDPWYSMETDMRKRLRGFFIDEIAVVKGVANDRAAAMFDGVMQ